VSSSNFAKSFIFHHMPCEAIGLIYTLWDLSIE
jgi:hypothetical protein